MPDTVRLIGVDLMDTVIADPWAEALEEVTGLPLAEVLSLRDRRAWIAFERGELDEEAYARRFFPPGTGRSLDGRALREALRSRYRFLPGMEELLGRLSAQGRLAALSNYPVWIDWLSDRFELERFFERVFVSCRLGARKPEPAFFRSVLEETGLHPSQLLLVDDRAENVDGAAALGIPGLRFTGASELEGQLADRGLLGPT